MSNNGRTITRLRPSFTCVPCKRRKVKCDKQKPGCRHCAKTDVVCFYDTIATGTTNSSQQNALPPPSSSSKRRRVSQEEEDATGCIYHSPAKNRDMEISGGTPPSMDFGGSDVTMASDVGNHSRVTPESYANSDSMLDGATWDDLHELDTLHTFPPPDSGFDPHASNLLPTPPLSIDNVQSTGWGECSTDLGWLYNHRSHISGPPSQTCSPPPSTTAPQLFEPEKSIISLNVPQPQDSGNEPPHCPVGRAFWAFFGGSAGYRNSHTDSERFRQAQQKKYLDRKLSGRRLSKLHQMARNVPPKSLCDVLLQSFLIGVHPLLPLVDVETLRARYDDFWSQRSQERSLVRGEYDFARVPFLGLLWAVLYCGAVAAPSSVQDKTSPLRTPVPEAFLACLKSKLNKTLSLSCYHEVATLDGLVASVLVFECDPDMDGLIGGPSGLSRLVQAAKTLGIDCEGSWNGGGKSDVERDTSRRVWKHIVHLQIMSAFTSGGPLPSQLGKIDADEGDNHDVLDDMTSTALILAAGRYETTRTLRHVVEKCSDTQNGMATETSEALERYVAKFHSKIDDLISRLSARGLPEHGQIPSQLFEASSLSNPQLYGDYPRQPTVLNSFARILLSMMKHHISIVSGRMLGSPWNSLIPNCILFLHNYLHVSQLPAFYPYRWFSPGKWQPLHECFVVLEYLKQSGQGHNVQLLHYLLNEVFDIFKPREGSDESGTVEPWQRAACELYAAPWTILRQIYHDIEGRKCRDSDPLTHPPTLQSTTSSYSLHRQSRMDFVLSLHSNNNFYPTPRQGNEAKAVTASTHSTKWTKLSSVDNTLGQLAPQNSVATKDPRALSKGAHERKRGVECDAIAGPATSNRPVIRHTHTLMDGSGGGAPPTEILPSRQKSPRRPLSHHHGDDDGDGDDDSHGDDSQDDIDEMENVWNDFIVLG
ncbi:hypothetical protein HD806DRAFT_490614 [Xylariaceae sp. AK1471]|nr:hypothetical protein HD806DRAFT_490614 [Xylariaceae sp. AK1471]